MTVRIQIATTLLGPDALTGAPMLVQVKDSNDVIHATQAQMVDVAVDQVGYAQAAEFPSLPPGTAHFMIASGGWVVWRSGPIVIADSDLDLDYTLIQLPPEDLTYTADDMLEQIEFPIVSSAEEDVDDPAEADTIIVIESMSAAVNADHLAFLGSGFYGDRVFYETGDPLAISLGSSNLEFTYRLRLEPSDAFHGQMLALAPLQPIEIGFANPLVAFGALFLTSTINTRARLSIEDRINRNVQTEIADRVGGPEVDQALVDRSTASIRSVTADGASGTVTFDALLSLPTELVFAETSGGNGCTTPVLLAALASAAALAVRRRS